MAVVVELYNDFSDKKELVFCECGKSVLENFPIETDWKNYKIICNGKFVIPDHTVTETDHIIIRKIPFGITTAIAIGAGVLAVASLGVALYAGVEAYKSKKALAKLQEEQQKTKDIMKDDVTNLPSLRGASNTVSNGKTQPYFIGKHLFTPYIMNAGKNYKGFHTIAGDVGEKEFYNVVLECGFNKQSLKKIYCDDVTLKTWNNNEVQEGTFNFDSASAFASSDSFGEIAQDGADFQTSVFNQKIIEQSINDQVEKHTASETDDKNLYYTLENNSMGADVTILLNGCQKWNTETGQKEDSTRHIITEYSVDYAHLVAVGDSNPSAHATWVSFPFTVNGALSNYFTFQSSTQMRFNAHVDFDYDEIFNSSHQKKYSEPVTIRVSTDDEKPENEQAQNEVFVQYIHSYCYNTKTTKSNHRFMKEKIIESREMALSTVLGIKIEATTNNEDKLKSIQIITSGIAKTYNGTTWSTNKTPTSNPASWLLEVLTSDAHKPSQIDEDEIDLDSLGAWYQYCSTKGLTVNFVITSGMTKKSVFDLICECGNGHMYQNIYGQIAIAIDDEKPNAIAVLNEQNLISFNYTKEIKRKPDGLKITFVDESLEYQENTIIIMADGSNPDDRSADSVLSSVKIEGKTNYTEACRFGYRLLKKEKLRPKTVNAEMGEEGLFFTPLSKVLVQHPSLKIGKGNGEIKNLIMNEENTQILGLELYDSVVLDENANYSMIVQAVGNYAGTDYCTPLEITIKGNKGITDEVEFVNPLPITARVIPHAHDNFSYGLGTENVVDEMLISKIDRASNGYKLTLVDYDERIYSDSETLPDYEPSFSTPKKEVGVKAERPYVSFDELYGVKEDVEDSIDSKIAAKLTESSPTYTAIFNTKTIKKDNTGSYTPAIISAKGYENKGLTEQTLFSGKWHVFINESSTEYATISGSSLSLDISEILDSGINNIDTIRISFKTNDGTVLIAEELIPILTGASGYTVRLSTPSIVLEGDENKKVTETTIKTKADVYYGLKELSYRTSDGWEYGVIETPDGMNISVDVESGEITFTILEGNALADIGTITIPIFIHSQSSTQIVTGFTAETRATKIIVAGFSGVTIGYYQPDENGYYNTYFSWQKLSQNSVKLANLTQTVNNYWRELTNDLVVTLAEKHVLERILNDIIVEHGKYYEYNRKFKKYANYNSKYNTLKTAVENLFNDESWSVSPYTYHFADEIAKNDFNELFDLYYGAKADLDDEIAATDKNYKGINTESKITALNPKVNDFFMWSGENNTVYGSIILKLGMTYCWNGDSWEEDNNRTHIMTTMDEALDVATIQSSEDESIPAISFAKRLITLQLIAEDIFSKYVEVENIMTEGKTTIDGGKITANTVDVEKLIVNDAFMDSLALRVLNIQSSGIIKSNNWDGVLSVVNKGDWVHADNTIANVGDYYLESGTYKVYTNINYPKTFIDTKRNVSPEYYTIDQAGKYVSITQTVIKNTDGDILKISAYWTPPYGGTPYTKEYYLYVGDSCILYSYNFTSICIWDGETLLKTNGNAMPQLLTKKADYNYSKKTMKGRYGFIIDANGDAEFNNDMQIGGDTVIKGDTNITGNTDIDGSLDIGGNTHIGGNCNVDGTMKFTGNTTIEGNSTYKGVVTAKGFNCELEAGSLTMSSFYGDVSTFFKGGKHRKFKLTVFGNGTIRFAQTIYSNISDAGSQDVLDGVSLYKNGSFVCDIKPTSNTYYSIRDINVNNGDVLEIRSARIQTRTIEGFWYSKFDATLEFKVKTRNDLSSYLSQREISDFMDNNN